MEHSISNICNNTLSTPTVNKLTVLAVMVYYS